MAASTDVPPPVAFPTPVVSSVNEALDDLTCRMERLAALYKSVLGEMHDLVTHLPSKGGEIAATTSSRFYQNWLIAEVAGEKLREIDDIIAAACERGYADRREAQA